MPHVRKRLATTTLTQVKERGDRWVWDASSNLKVTRSELFFFVVKTWKTGWLKFWKILRVNIQNMERISKSSIKDAHIQAAVLKVLISKYKYPFRLRYLFCSPIFGLKFLFWSRALTPYLPKGSVILKHLVQIWYCYFQWKSENKEGWRLWRSYKKGPFSVHCLTHICLYEVYRSDATGITGPICKYKYWIC